MAAVTVRTPAGDDAGTIELDGDVFGVEPNEAVLHQVVTAQLAARRRGTHSTLTRAEVRGGGAKPWRQKGTGRARQGSIRSPQWRGGGVAFGPKPRDYAQRTPKKMVRLALRSALSDRAADGKVVVVDEWRFDVPRTREARAALEALGLDGRVLVVLSPGEITAWKSFRNLPQVHLLETGQLNAYDVLVSDVVVFTRQSLPSTGVGTPAPAGTGSMPTRAPRPTAAPEAAPAESTPGTVEVDGAADKGDGPAGMAPAKKKVVKKVIKKVVKKKAPAAGDDAPSAQASGGPTMKPAGFSFNQQPEAADGQSEDPEEAP